MPWQNGTFVRLYSWVSDAAANFDIDASRMDDDTNDIVAGLNHCLTVDGQNPATSITLNGPLTASGLGTFNGGLAWAGGAAGDTLTLSGAAPQITLSNAASNWLAWNASGIAVPQAGTRSPGTKLVLYPSLSSTSCDFAIGIQTGAMWFSGDGFYWYNDAAVVAMALDGPGDLTAGGQIHADGAISAGGAISASGIGYFNGITVNGASGITGGLTLDALTVTTNAVVEGQLNLTGPGYALVAGNGGIDVAGSSVIGGDLTVNGTGYGINVTSGAINTAGGLVTAGGLSVGAGASFAANVNVTGTVTAGVINPGSETVTGGGTAFVVNNSALIGGNLQVNGNATVASAAINQLTVTGGGYALQVPGGGIYSAGGVDFVAGGSFGAAVTIAGQLTITGQASGVSVYCPNGDIETAGSLRGVSLILNGVVVQVVAAGGGNLYVA